MSMEIINNKKIKFFFFFFFLYLIWAGSSHAILDLKKKRSVGLLLLLNWFTSVDNEINNRYHVGTCRSGSYASSGAAAAVRSGRDGSQGQLHLAVQDVSKLDASKLSPLSLKSSLVKLLSILALVFVAHGKSTVVKAISGVKTVRFKNELERNITIGLDANAKIYECTNPECPAWLVHLAGSSHADTFQDERGTWELRRHVGFVDCPGHDILMATMLNGAAVMDAALLVAGNETCPQPRTSEHLAAVEIMQLKHIHPPKQDRSC